jgi:hypothetical protein
VDVLRRNTRLTNLQDNVFFFKTTIGGTGSGCGGVDFLFLMPLVSFHARRTRAHTELSESPREGAGEGGEWEGRGTYTHCLGATGDLNGTGRGGRGQTAQAACMVLCCPVNRRSDFFAQNGESL